MLEVSADVCALFNADRLTIYSMGEDKSSIVSKVKTGLNSFKDLKLPIAEHSIAGYVALHLGWALLYAHVARWLPGPDWVGGLLFALLPLTVAALVLLPALGAGPLGLDLGAGLLPLAGEVLRNAAYGVSLATGYTLLNRARLAAA